jgi:DNA-binding transcriptional MerR regulator
MKFRYLPGTNLQIAADDRHEVERVLTSLFSMTGGIFLSQLSDLTGMPAATLQNWVKRGYVSSPVDRKYSMRQTTRIIHIALLRQTMPMEDIVSLLSSINNNLADESDDLIDDSKLYFYFSDILLHLPGELFFDREGLLELIAERTSDFELSNKTQRDCLTRVLCVMVQAYAASWLSGQVKQGLQELKEGVY